MKLELWEYINIGQIEATNISKSILFCIMFNIVNIFDEVYINYSRLKKFSLESYFGNNLFNSNQYDTNRQIIIEEFESL